MVDRRAASGDVRVQSRVAEQGQDRSQGRVIEHYEVQSRFAEQGHTGKGHRELRSAEQGYRAQENSGKKRFFTRMYYVERVPVRPAVAMAVCLKWRQACGRGREEMLLCCQSNWNSYM